LKRALREVKNDYDIVVIDNAPTFSNITINALFCSNNIIIPIKPGGFELDGLIDTMEELFAIEYEYEIEYNIKILMNMIPRGNRPDYINFISKMREFFGDCVINTTIGYQDAVASHSTMSSKLIINDKSKIGDDYRYLVNELALEID
jgi:chromosome partitioning protein